MSVAELGLGTVQWGMPYGLTNGSGLTPRSEVAAILEEAKHRSVRVLDTASQYGVAEAVIGENDLKGFRLVTKTPSFGGAQITPQRVTELADTFYRSLERLGLNGVYGLLVHRADDLFLPGGERLLEAVLELRRQGLISKIGVSVYDGAQVDTVMRLFKPDIIQLPLSVLDQRLVYSGHIARLSAAQVEVHARSVFLQGLLLMPSADLPAFFEPIRPLLLNWHKAVEKQGMTPTQAALAFARDTAGVAVVLVGVDGLQHFRACVADYNLGTSFDASGLSCDSETYVNPMYWKLN